MERPSGRSTLLHYQPPSANTGSRQLLEESIETRTQVSRVRPRRRRPAAAKAADGVSPSVADSVGRPREQWPRAWRSRRESWKRRAKARLAAEPDTRRAKTASRSARLCGRRRWRSRHGYASRSRWRRGRCGAGSSSRSDERREAFANGALRRGAPADRRTESQSHARPQSRLLRRRGRRGRLHRRRDASECSRIARRWAWWAIRTRER